MLWWVVLRRPRPLSFVMSVACVQDAPSGWSTTFGRGKLPAPAKVTLFQSRAGVVLFWLTLAGFVGLAFATWRR